MAQWQHRAVFPASKKNSYPIVSSLLQDSLTWHHWLDTHMDIAYSFVDVPPAYQRRLRHNLSGKIFAKAAQANPETLEQLTFRAFDIPDSGAAIRTPRIRSRRRVLGCPPRTVSLCGLGPRPNRHCPTENESSTWTLPYLRTAFLLSTIRNRSTQHSVGSLAILSRLGYLSQTDNTAIEFFQCRLSLG